jgi:O-antigen ligase
MRKAAWVLLLVFAFTVPWEYSLDLGPPLGNVARIAGFLLLLAAIPAVLQAGRLRAPGAMQWMVLAFFLWFCCSCFWSMDSMATWGKVRAYFQETMVVWLVWELAESPRDLRALLRAWVAGSWVLAALTVANLASPEAIAAGQIRFAAEGQDPNDVARFLDLGFPMAALLFDGESRWPGRLLAAGYLPFGLIAVLLTASRGGFLAAIVALTGCAILLARGHPRRVLAGALSLPAIGMALWYTVPHETIERLATISEQIRSADLNLRWSIWAAGWHAFVQAPLLGRGAGTFVAAAGLAPADTAHNTALSVAVGGGLCALFLAVAIVALAVWSILQARGVLRLALLTALVVWMVTSLVASVEESRTTWLLLGLIAMAGRLAVDEPEELTACFPDFGPTSRLQSIRDSMQSGQSE